jgi:predicted RNA-binding protein YlqC (UPF0109 family)
MTVDYVDLVEFIVKNIVDHPEAVVVEAVEGRGRSETLEIRLDPGDVGRVIGKGGRNIEAIRSLVKASAIKEHHRVNVEVIADEDEREPYVQGNDDMGDTATDIVDEGEPVTAGAPSDEGEADGEPASPGAVEG